MTLLEPTDRRTNLATYLAHLKGEVVARRTGSNDVVRTYRGDSFRFITEGLRDFRGDSWETWRVVLKAAYGKPLDAEEREVFATVAGGREPPPGRVKELWCLIGARGGKDSVASAMAVEAACYADEGVSLRPGQRAIVACFATKLDQASIIYNYIRAYFERIPSLRSRVVTPFVGVRPRPILLDNDVEIRTVVNNFTAPRGWPIACAVFDEIAFWRDESSAIPDEEVYTAVLRGMGTIPSAMIIAITTTYRQAGLYYKKYKRYYGENDPHTLVVKGPTTQFHPGFDESVIQRSLDEDYEKGAAEYLATFRHDLADYVSREVAEGAVVNDRMQLPPASGRHYVAFTDPSGGSADSFTLAIAHAEDQAGSLGKIGVLDCLLERRAPFSPASVVEEFSKTLKEYGLFKVTGDHYAAEWPVERFSEHGIVYEQSELVKSDIYRDFLPLLNAGRIEFLDHSRMVNQLCALERRAIRGGRDRIDHPPGAHDDLINSAAGALLAVAGAPDNVTRFLRSMGA